MIRGKKVDLVAPSMDYLDHYMKWFNDPEVTDMLGDAKMPFAKEKEREWIEKQLAPSDEHRVFTVLTKDGKPIGNIGFNEICYQCRNALIGIAIGEKTFWNKGYGTDALLTLMKFGFEELAMEKLELGVHSSNKRAQACYQKCGFKVEGVQRMHDYYNGENIDALLMGVLKEEWLRVIRLDKPKKRCD